MNKLKKVSIAAALLASAGAMSMSAIAGPGHQHDKKAHYKEKLYKKLELTEAQRAQIKANKEQRHAQMKASKVRMSELKKELHEVMQQDNLDRGRLRSLLAQEADLKAEKMAQKHAAGQEFRAMLTDEQRVKLKEFKARMQEKRAAHKEMRKERRGEKTE
ncbi:MAG: periplasmic heavy metal sensor [Gammaproteobacteria bacterium]|nr:periplasmic heavy metal sensor [Gammaproteobacteria bacterium]